MLFPCKVPESLLFCYQHSLTCASILFVQDGGSPVVEYEAGVLDAHVF